MYVTRDNFSHNFVAATVCYSRRFFIATCKIRATILQFFELQHVAATKCCVKSHPVRHAIVSCNIIYKWTLYSQWTFLLIFNIFCPGYGSSIFIPEHSTQLLSFMFHPQNIQSGFHVSDKSISRFIWFYFAFLFLLDWLKKTRATFSFNQK